MARIKFYTVREGQQSSGIVLNAGDSMCVMSGGYANSTTVNSYCVLDVSSGGTATNVIWTPCVGEVWMEEGAYVTFASRSGVYYGSDDKLLSSAKVMESKTFDSDSRDSMCVMSGGTANDTTVQGPGNELRIYSGGTANYTTVDYCLGGDPGIYSGGGWGCGGLRVYSGGVANRTTVNSWGWLRVHSGGTATNIVWTPCEGHVYVADGGYATFVSRYSGVYFGSDNKLLSHASVMDGRTIGSYGGEMCVMSGGTANRTTVNYRSYLFVSSGGVANSTTVVAGKILVSSGGTANYTAVDGGLEIFSGGVANHTTVNGRLTVSHGGVVNHTTVNDGLLEVSGGVVNHTTVNSWGNMYVYSGVANSTTVNYSSYLIVSGGVANSTTVNSGGGLEIYSGGTAMSIKENGGYVLVEEGANVTFASHTFSGLVLFWDSATVHSGTTANRTTVAEGKILVSSGGVANSTTVNSSGYLFVSSGGIVNNTTVNSGAGLYVSSGGTAMSIKENGGYVSVAEGANVTFVSHTISGLVLSWGSATVHSGTTAHSTTVNSSGRLEISSGGKLTGLTTIASGGCVHIYSGAKLDFDISNLAPGTTARVNDLSRVSNWSEAIFSLTVGGAMSNGTYSLAENASGFNRTISVVNNSGVQLGTLSVGETIRTNDQEYTLNLSGGSLTVTAIVDRIAPEISLITGSPATETTGSVTVTATFTDNVAVASTYYKLGDSGSWRTCSGSVTVTENAIVSFKAVDTSGNESNVYSYVVSNIVKPKPVQPTASADITTLTNQAVTVTALFGNDSAQKQYSLDGQNWSAYLSGVRLMQNGTVYFRGISSAGTVSDVTSYTVSNIDKTAPEICLITGSPATATTGSVTVTATFTDNVAVAATYYKLGENGTWRTCPGSAIVTENTIVSFKAVDAVGNESPVYSYVVSNIQVPPEPEPEPVVPEPVIHGKLPIFTGDFIGNGKSLLAVKDENAVRIYRNNGTVWSELTLADGWEVVGTGDFNADKKDDFLRVNTEGYVVCEMSNGDGTFAAQVLNLKNAGWSILGTGDFNGNGSDDVLIANPTVASETVGLLGYWESGVTWTLINGYSAEWEMVSTGDFNGDGKCDMLWKNEFIGDGDLTYNAYCTWIVEDPVDWRMVSVANPSEWNFLCSGDFDGDKMNDIAMINDVGVVGIWGVNDGYLSSWSILSAVTSEWTLAGVADFNGDGTDDIAWSNTDTGLTGYWQINDKTLTTWANLATIS